MPVQEVALPVGATGLGPNLPTIIRSSKDGDIPVIQIFTGDYFVGDVLEGNWRKWNNNASTLEKSVITGGDLELTASGNSSNYTAVISKSPVPILQDVTLDVHLKIASAPASGTISAICYLNRENDDIVISETTGDFYLVFWIQRDTSDTKISVRKVVNGSSIVIYAATVITNNEGTFRVKFRPSESVIDVYFKDGSGDVTESTDELTLTDDTLDMFSQDFFFPSINFSHDTTTSYTINSEKITIDYPVTGIAFDQDSNDIGKGDVKIYDAMGSASEADWRRVYSEDHDFIGNCVIENGLIRMVIDEYIDNKMYLYYWNGSSWTLEFNGIAPDRQQGTPAYFAYPYLMQINTVNTGFVSVEIQLPNTATKYSPNRVTVNMTMRRGDYHVAYNITEVLPQDVELSWRFYNVTPRRRWNWCGDDFVADDDLDTTVTNTVMSDNYQIIFDDAGNNVFGFIASNQKPNGSVKAFYSSGGDYISLRYISPTDFDNTIIYIGVVPYSKPIANLFQEAESGTTTGTDDVSDGSASGGYKVTLGAQNENVYVTLSGVDDLPVGRYRMIVRAYDANQVSDDLELYVYNQPESRYLNEDRAATTFTPTASWLHYSVVFDITQDDIGEEIRFYVNKGTATSNTIHVDYFLIIPLGNGESWGSDIAHNVMRRLDIGFRLTDKSSYKIFAGMGLTYAGLLGSDSDAIHVNVPYEIQPITVKGSPVAGDVLVIEDSGADYAKRSITIGTLPAGSPSFGVPTGDIDLGDSAVEGSSGDATRADHQHQFSAPGAGYPLDIEATESDGTASTPARSDHVHGHGSGYLPNAHHGQSHGASDHSGDVLPNANQELGAFFLDIGEIATPADPGADIRRVFVDSGTGEISVRTPGGSTVSLEQAGGADPDAIHDNVADEITAITPKIALAAADEFVLEDSGASFVKKAVTFANIESSISLANLSTRNHASLSDAPADAHHVEFVSTDADTLISTHASDDNAHHEVIEQLDVESIITTEIGPGESIDNAIDSLILTHKQISDDHHSPTVAGDLNHNDLANIDAGDINHLTDTQMSALHAEAHILATTGPHSSALPLIDIASYTQGSIIIGGGTDWQALGVGDADQVLTSDGTDVTWEDPTGGVEGSGTQYALTMWTDAGGTVIGDSMLSQDMGGATLYAPGAIAMSGAAVRIDINPSGSGADVIFDITPTAPLVGSITWKGIALNLDNLTPIAGGTSIYGTDIDMTGIGLTQSPNLAGLRIQMPATYGGGTEYAASFTGDARTVLIATDTYALEVTGEVKLNTINSEASDVNKFLVDSSGIVKFRTGAEAYSDMDGYTSSDFTSDFSGESLANLTTRTHASLSDAPADAHHIEFVAADFTTAFAAETLANLATRTHASLSDAPEDAHHNKVHALVDMTNHPESGLTNGQFLKATGTTTYAFGAHGLGASDVGAYTTAQTDSAIDTDISTHTGDDNAHHEVIETTDVETIIIAELVNDQSIDLAIDALILTHKNISTAHHTPPVAGDFNHNDLANIDAGDINHLSDTQMSALHDIYTDASAIAAVVGEDPLALTNAIKIGGDSIEDSAGSEMIGFTGDGYIGFLASQGSPPTTGDVLAWNNSNSRWEVSAQAGAGGITGSGTNDQITKWNSAGSTIEDSLIADDGTSLVVSGGVDISFTAGARINAIAGTNDHLVLNPKGTGSILVCWDDGTGGFQVGDGAGNPVFVVDNAGNITDIALAHATVDTDKFAVLDGSQLKYRSGSELLSDIGASDFDGKGTGFEFWIGGWNAPRTPQSNGTTTTAGRWELTSGGNIHFDLDRWFPVTVAGGTIKITEITFYFDTTATNAYINAHSWYKSHVPSATSTVIDSDFSDSGNGTTGDDSRTITTDYTRQVNYGMTLNILIVVGSGSFFLHGVQVKYDII